jgi:hypothetical protein
MENTLTFLLAGVNLKFKMFKALFYCSFSALQNLISGGFGLL